MVGFSISDFLVGVVIGWVSIGISVLIVFTFTIHVLKQFIIEQDGDIKSDNKA